jgi:superoxide dismutase, Fe-Mn family
MRKAWISRLTRRESLALGLGAAAAAFFGGRTSAFAQAPAAPAAPAAPEGPFVLPPLPYANDALEPFIDAETMRIHHDKHHRAYVENANKLLAGVPALGGMSPEEVVLNLDKAPEDIRTGLLNNVGGHINHSLFWQMMAPGAGGPPTGPIAAALDKEFGSFQEFQKQFNEAAMKRFGSGWAWLVMTPEGKLSVLSTPNQNPPVIEGRKPLLGLDVWEHAYYLKYQNRRADYATTWWNTVNWDFVNRLFAAAGGA